MENIMFKLLTILFIIGLLQIIVSIIMSKYYVKGFAEIPGEKIFKSKEAKGKALIINNIHMIIVMILITYTLVTTLIPYSLPMLKSILK